MVGIIPALVIPIQAILATAMLFNWAAPISTISLVPSIWVFLLFLVLSIVTHKFAKLFANFVGNNLKNNFNQQDMTHLIYESSLLAFQVPAILVYGFLFGIAVIALTLPAISRFQLVFHLPINRFHS